MIDRDAEESTIHANVLMAANGDRDLALRYAVRELNYWRRHCSAGFVREDPATQVRVPKPRVEPILIPEEAAVEQPPNG